MKKIIQTLFISLLLIIILDKILFSVINYFYKKSYVGQDGGEINRYLSDKNPPPLAIMGSSTARFQVNPDSFPYRACNLAHHSSSDCFQLALLNLMIGENKIPENILLTIYPKNYIKSEISEKQSSDILFLKYYYNRSDFIKTAINNINWAEKYKFLFSSYKFNGIVSNTFWHYLNSKSVNDSTPYYFKYQQSGPKDLGNVTKKISEKVVMYQKPAELSGLKTSYLPIFIEICKKNKINLAAYYMPMLIDDSVKLRNAIDFADSLLKAEGVPFFKFTNTNAYDLLNNYNYWTDGQHLNDKGGAIESKILADFIKDEASKK